MYGVGTTLLRTLTHGISALLWQIALHAIVPTQEVAAVSSHGHSQLNRWSDWQEMYVRRQTLDSLMSVARSHDALGVVQHHGRQGLVRAILG
jgi:hypothetical protein